jgi:hypothetical protein
LNKEVEILKIGSIIPDVISKWKILEEKEGKDTIMVVFNGGPVFDHYVNILKEKCGDEYKYLKTDQAIVGTPTVWVSSLGYKQTKILKGLSDGEPTIGNVYTINNGSWHTSTVMKIIDEDIIITKNSVYAIHDVSKLREKKLNDLGIN